MSTGTLVPRVGLVATLSVLLGSGCASSSSGDHSATTSVPALGTCTVRIENGTGLTLNLYYRAGAHRASLGLADPGSGFTVGVPCDEGRIGVSGAVAVPGNGFDQYGAGARLEPGSEAVVKLTEANRIRR